MDDLITTSPGQGLDYAINWDTGSAPVLLAGEKVITSTWTFRQAGNDTTLSLSNGSISPDGKTTTIWITGGTPGLVYYVTNKVVTDNATPRTYERTFALFVNLLNTL